MKTGSAINEANRIAAAKAKRAARKSSVPRPKTAIAQALPTCPRCQRIFRARIGLTTSQYLLPVTPTTATNKAIAFTTSISDGGSLLNCPHCDRTFTSRIGLVSHLRNHLTETGEPVPGAATHSRDRHLHFPHCPRAFTHRMSLFGHVRIHDNGIHHDADNTDIPCTPSAPAILTATATPTNMNDIPPASTDFCCASALATSKHASTWSVTCESIARTLVNKCLGRRRTVAAPGSTALTAPAHLHTAWAF
ncbi:unnamed protein product [Schistocephalus solidus]|uniref:C2H2-type domain-containing protein n=1 Tax=Schistocephalus solidus TaxID=70667 RepID=A0A183TCJ4_SCHSO|nr:unnamed protein product [Schistocephalus solidus]